LIFFLILELCFPVKINANTIASIVISKIAAFEKSGYEWVEIINRSDNPIDTTGWKFWENKTNHKWSLAQGDDLILDAGERAIIAQNKDKFLENHPGYKGVIIDSAWGSLKESGEEIGLKNANLETIEDFLYIKCPDGVLERTNINLNDYTSGNWTEKTNKEIEEIEEPKSLEKPQTTQTNRDRKNDELIIDNPKLIIENHPPVAIIGDDLEINAGDTVFFDGSDSFDEDGDDLEYFWDFGDGNEGEGAQIDHKYEHYGRFSAILRVSDGKTAASNAIWVNAVKIDYSKNIHINSFLPNPAGPDMNNEWIEICNSGLKLTNLSNWILDDIQDGGSNEYAIKNTEIDAKECVKFYRKETKIALNNNGDVVRLINPAGEIVDEIKYDKIMKDNEILYQDTSPKKQETNKDEDKIQGLKSKIQINNKIQNLNSNETETNKITKIGEIKSQKNTKSNSPIYQSANFRLSVNLPAAVKTEDIYGGTLNGELVKVAGVVKDKSGNVFFINDGSREARIWFSPKSKIDYSAINVGKNIIIIGMVSKTDVGYRIIAKNLK